MGRVKSAVPKLQYHISGQAICQIDGVTYYLGKYESPAAHARYSILLDIYQKNDRKVPPGITSEYLKKQAIDFELPLAPIRQESEPVRVDHLAIAYVAHCETYHAGDPGALHKAKKVCADLRKNAGDTLADDFGPVLLRKIRDNWIKEDNCRRYVNTLTNLAIRVFSWGVSHEMIKPETYIRLKTIEALRKGRTTARETKPIQPVKLAHVRATLEHLSPVLKAMLRVHVGTGMRPSELCTIRPIDIDRSGPEWLYVPQSHKGTNSDRERIIPIVGDAKDALLDYMNRPAVSYCFSPAEAVSWHTAKKRSTRKSKVQPSQVDRSKADPSVKPGDRYDKDSYRRALQRAAKKANVPQWTPYEIRHLVGTVVAEALKLENAKALLGHSDISITQRYSKATTRQAIEAAKHAPTLKGAE